MRLSVSAETETWRIQVFPATVSYNSVCGYSSFREVTVTKTETETPFFNLCMFHFYSPRRGSFFFCWAFTRLNCNYKSFREHPEESEFLYKEVLDGLWRRFSLKCSGKSYIKIQLFYSGLFDWFAFNWVWFERSWPPSTSYISKLSVTVKICWHGSGSAGVVVAEAP